MATINGTAGNDTLIGTAGSDTVSGFGGNDSVSGSGGVDWVEGGAGNDTVRGGSGQDSLVFREAGTANADLLEDYSSNHDNIQLDAAFFSAIGVSGRFASGDARFWSSTSGTAHDASDRIVLNTSTGQLWYDADGNGTGFAALLIATLPSGRTVVASDIWSGGGETINGTSGDDSLVGGPGDDTINGFAGEDTIDGGAGADSMTGGAHADTYFVDHLADAIVEFENGGIDNVNASVNYRLADWVNNLTLTGTTAVFGTGNELDNVITGNGASNRLEGGRGNDTIIGGAGDDRFAMSGENDGFPHNPGNDVVDGGDGSDLVAFAFEDSSTTEDATVNLSTGTYSVSGATGTASGTLTSIEHATGSWGDDHITGTDGANILWGIAGDDTVRGLGGDDTLTGHDGADLLDGGDGNDLLLGGGDDFTDRFVFSVAPGAANADLIFNFVSLEDKIVLDGAVHANSGPSGNFAAGDARFWSSGTGTAHDADDRVIYNTSSGELWYDADGNGSGARQLIATLSETPSVVATDIEVINGSAGGEVINGTSGNDTLTGTSGNDTINGLGGNDLVQAGATGGADVVNGGAGFDSIEFASRATSAMVVDCVAGTITGGSSGTISFTGVERIVATNFNDSLIGNGAAQNLTGRGGADTLWGASGNDTLWGGGGADTFIFRETGNANADSVRDWASGADKVALDNSPMSGLGAMGNFAAGDARFWSSTSGTAHDASDRVIYNTSTGSLYYDADGNGAGTAQLIATFQGAPGVVETDIFVI